MNRQRAQRLRAALFVGVVVTGRRPIGLNVADQPGRFRWSPSPTDPPLNSPMPFALLVGTLFSFVTLCRFDA